MSSQILGQPAERVVDSRVERHLGGSPLELLGRQALEELDRIVVDLAPQRRVQLAKQRDHVGLPGPPEVPGQLTKLIHQLRLTDHGHSPQRVVPQRHDISTGPRPTITCAAGSRRRES